MPSAHKERATPADDDWTADSSHDYEVRKAKGEDWEFLTDDEIVIIQIQEFHDKAYADTYRKDREREEAKNSD